MNTVAIAIVCKTPLAGSSKTRLSPPLDASECAAISACFIRDIARTVVEIADERPVSPYALYAPVGTEPALQRLLPQGFRLLPQCEGDLGVRLTKGARDLLGRGHRAMILMNSDAPTLPPTILRDAVDALQDGDRVILGPALDGGYTLIGLSRPHERLFADIPWSTPAVYAATVERARELALPVVDLAPWYDVDDEASYRILERECAGVPPDFAETLIGAPAAETRRFVLGRREAKRPQ